MDINDANYYSNWAEQLRSERDEARRTCSLVQDDFTRVERERDEALAELKQAWAAHDVAKGQNMKMLDEKQRAGSWEQQDLEDQLSACRASNAELQRERDEARTAHDVTKSQLIAARAAADRARADAVAEKGTNASLHASRELALAELDEKVKRIAELEASRMGLIYCASSRQNTIDEQVQRIAELEGEIRLWDQSATRQTEALRAARVPAADWRKTRDEMVAELSEWLDLHDKLTAGVLLAWLLRWEPKP